MKETTSQYVYPVINYALQLEKLVQEGKTGLEIDAEQASLRSYLLTEDAARQDPDFGGSSIHIRPGEPGRRTADGFLGIRYLLTCWLDEVFMLNTPWHAWKSMEWDLYHSNDGGSKFWDQVKMAEGRSNSAPLEVALLLSMLGFRGIYRDSPDELIKPRVNQSLSSDFQLPDGIDPDKNVPRRRGREKHERMVLAWMGVILISIFVVALLAVSGYFSPHS